MRNTLQNISLSVLLLTGAAFAQEPTQKETVQPATNTVSYNTTANDSKQSTKSEFLWVSEGAAQSSFQIQLGGGLLDNKGITGHKGSPIIVLFKANYAIDDTSSLFIEVPLAGTISGGPDDFGMGNISIGGNHQFVNNSNVTAGLGLNATFPTSQNAAAIGTYTRNFYSFVKDQYAISPYLDLHLIGDKVSAAFDVGLNEQIHTNTAPGQDKYDSILFYDAGLSLAMTNSKDYFATLEFGGFTTLSYTNNDTVLFGGPGVRYQNDEFSFGLHLEAPFTNPSNDQIDVMVLADTRFKF